MKKEIKPILQFTAILIIGSVIILGTSFLVYKFRKPEIIERIEKCQCSGLTSEDVRLILRQEFVNALEFNYAIDDSLGNPKLVPLLKSICK